jgi:ATP-dependent protease ClpP protease subunit
MGAFVRQQVLTLRSHWRFRIASGAPRWRSIMDSALGAASDASAVQPRLTELEAAARFEFWGESTNRIFFDDRETAVIKFNEELLWNDTDEIVKTIQKAKTVHLHIHSYGGCVDSAFRVRDALAAKTVTATIGIAASAATILALTAPVGNRRILRGGQLMFHRLHSFAAGDWRELARASYKLWKTQRRYRLLLEKNCPRHLVRKWLRRGDHWLGHSEAQAAGLVGQIVEPVIPPQ